MPPPSLDVQARIPTMPGLVDDSEARKVSRQIDEALNVRVSTLFSVITY